MSSPLVQAQQLFAYDLGRLLMWATANGYRYRMGEGYVGDSIDKPTEDSPHIRRGLHFQRLAQDLILDGPDGPLYDTEAYRSLGAYWKSLRPENRWGGDFPKLDGDHFSREWKGVQ